MTFAPKKFQTEIIDGLVARFRNRAAVYCQLGNADPANVQRARQQDAGVVLQAPTGSGKTAMAIRAMSLFSREEPVLWFWFAPFAGLVEQARSTLRALAPELSVLDVATDRQPAVLAAGAVFVTTWSAVAARNVDARKARVTGDTGLSLDALVELARQRGMRIGCVVDEAHHGFHSARQAQAFFRDVLRPDYALMMTATPRDADISAFERDTGYKLGDPADWASVSRADAVGEGLLKRGVRVVRFLARDEDTKQLVDFENLALRECTAVHRRLKAGLADIGLPLTPLMLVQVPDGKAAQEAARRHLVEELKFPADAVRIHTSDEPDPDLIALANDPTVEVLIFKMAVAMGFDAPRAFTLAALRGARDPSFGVQVIGRIVRVHALLQGRKDLPPEFDYGYVFLANAESQEGLASAGRQINTLRTQAPEIGSALAITYSGSLRAVQLAASGQSFALVFGGEGVTKIDEQEQTSSTSPAALEFFGDTGAIAQLALRIGEDAAAGETARPDPSGRLAALAMNARTPAHRYPRRSDVPAGFVSERLPAAPADIEMRLIDFVDFSDHVLATRDKSRTQIRRTEADVFAAGVTESDVDIWAKLSPAAVAGKAHQVTMALADINEREIRKRLLVRFRAAIEQAGAVPPDDEELLEQQLDLVLVRNPTLLRNAFRQMRMHEVMTVTAPQAGELISDLPLDHAKKNVFGVFPADMNPDESQVARLLDAHSQVRWWHRNKSDYRLPEAVGLYRWDEGDGFYPDFVVGMTDRTTPDGIALLEVKGSLFWHEAKEVAKAEAVHSDYGRVFMVGRKKGEKDFHFLRPLNDRLETEAGFDPARLRWI